jgi:hypothetical protein
MTKGVDVSNIESYDPKKDGGCAVTFGYDVDMPDDWHYLYDREMGWPGGCTSHLNDDVWNYIEKLCTIAEEYDAKAQFFLQGNGFERPFERWVRIVERGHAVDSHMYNHISLVHEPVETIESQARETKRLLEEKLNTVNIGVRGPGGTRAASMAGKTFSRRC